MTKRVVQYGTTGKVESVYGTDAQPDPSTDGIYPVSRPTYDFNFLDQGDRGLAPATGARAPRNRPSGREGGFTLTTDVTSLGRAYTAVVYRSPLDVILQASGLRGTFNAGAWTYEPLADPADMESATFYLYEREQLYKSLGSYVGTLLFSFDAGEAATWEADVVGVFPSVEDMPLPQIEYSSALPPQALDVSLMVNGETDLRLVSAEFALIREIAPRANDNASGHQGFAIGTRESYLTLVVESSPLSDLDPYTLWEDGSMFDVSFTVGSERFNRWSFNADNAQIENVVEEDTEEAIALWSIDMSLNTSTYGSSDEFSLTFD